MINTDTILATALHCRDNGEMYRLYNVVHKCCADIDAQAEENKRLEVEVANWRYWRGTATKANDKCEAENKRLMKVLEDMAKQHLISEMDEEDRDYADYEGAYEIFINQARAAIKTDTEEGRE